MIECKPPRKDVLSIADTAQVSDYWDRYNQVLVTNYREFLLIGRDEAGQPVAHEYYRLAATERNSGSSPASGKGRRATRRRLLDFLIRCIRRPRR